MSVIKSQEGWSEIGIDRWIATRFLTSTEPQTKSNSISKPEAPTSITTAINQPIVIDATEVETKAEEVSLARTCDELEDPKRRYVQKTAHLRSRPTRLSPLLAKLPPGQTLYKISEGGKWTRVNVATLNVWGYVPTSRISRECVVGSEIHRLDMGTVEIAQVLMRESLVGYRGSCPCPYNSDKAGRSCGSRSAYSRPGGKSPLCFASDITPQMIERFRTSRK